MPDSPDCVLRLGAHRGALRRWVIDIKHARWEPMAELLGEALAAQLRACGVVEQGDRGAILVPVPTPWLRARARGIDHARVVAASVARVLGVPCRRVLWQGLGATQVGVEARSGRLRERARFGTRRGGRATVAGRHVILVDDVRTTGSTLRACAGLLRGVGASRVTAAVLSVRERSEQLSTGFGAESPASDLRVLGHAV